MFLRILLTITATFEIFSLYMLYQIRDVYKHLTVGFMNGEVSTEGAVLLYAFVLLTLLLIRFHLVLDMSNKNLYRAVFWVHFFEAILFVGVPFYKGVLVWNVVSIVITITPIIMAFSYSSYLYPKNTKVEKKN
jgi:hypothetical protein